MVFIVGRLFARSKCSHSGRWCGLRLRMHLAMCYYTGLHDLAVILQCMLSTDLDLTPVFCSPARIIYDSHSSKHSVTCRRQATELGHPARGCPVHIIIHVRTAAAAAHRTDSLSLIFV